MILEPIKINLKKETIPRNMYSYVLLCDKISVLLGENINHELLCFQTNGETVTDFILGGSKITADGDCSHGIKRRLLLGRKAMTNLDIPIKM